MPWTGSMTDRDYAAALARRCPRCGAGPGVGCVDGAGRSWGLHLERFRRGPVALKESR